MSLRLSVFTCLLASLPHSHPPFLLPAVFESPPTRSPHDLKIHNHPPSSRTLSHLISTTSSCSDNALLLLVADHTTLFSDGRNSSTAFTLSSGTIGATLSAALSVPIPGPPGHPSSPSLHETHIPCIAVSYGPILGSAATHHTTPETLALANDAAVEACHRLWADWGREPEGGLVQVYSINVPLDEEVLAKDKRRFCWTTIRRNTYGSLFRTVDL